MPHEERKAAEQGSGPAASVIRPPSILRTPLSFEVQCWIAWAGLFAFGLRGVPVYRSLGAYPPLELGAVVLAICWAIDLVRTRVQLNRARARDAGNASGTGAAKPRGTESA